MAPIHETDIEKNRWDRESWRNFELWEKVESRIRRKNRNWIVIAALQFLLFSSVPVFRDSMPRWAGIVMVRNLAEKINIMKSEAVKRKMAIRLRFESVEDGTFVLEMVESCASLSGTIFQREALRAESWLGKVRRVSSFEARESGIPGVVDEICYDPLVGAGFNNDTVKKSAFGFTPIGDLEASRLDRVELLLMSGETLKISFN